MTAYRWTGRALTHRQWQIVVALLMLATVAVGLWKLLPSGRRGAQSVLLRAAMFAHSNDHYRFAIMLYEAARRADSRSVAARSAAFLEIGCLYHLHRAGAGDRAPLTRALALAQWAYDHSLADSPYNLNAASWVARLWADLGSPEKAVSFWDRHIAINPAAASNVEVVESRIHSYLRAGDLARALGEFRHLQKLPEPRTLQPGTYCFAVDSVAEALLAARGKKETLVFLHGVACQHRGRLGKVAAVTAARLSGDVGFLTNALTDPEVRDLTVSSLAKLGPTARAALPQLARLRTSTPDAILQSNIYAAIKRIAGPQSAAPVGKYPKEAADAGLPHIRRVDRE